MRNIKIDYMRNIEENQGETTLPRIVVKSPLHQGYWDKGKIRSYTTFEIIIQTEHLAYRLKSSSTRRRYSDFVWLKKLLKTHHPMVKPPELPPKKFFQNGFDPTFVEERRKGLEDFLNNVQCERYYISDSTFHLFVQTDLTCEQITDYLSGKLTQETLQRVWQAGGVQNCVETNSQERNIITAPQDSRQDDLSLASLSDSLSSASTCEDLNLVRNSPCFSINGEDNIVVDND